MNRTPCPVNDQSPDDDAPPARIERRPEHIDMLAERDALARPLDINAALHARQDEIAKPPVHEPGRCPGVCRTL
jgi:hypothetical protein